MRKVMVSEYKLKEHGFVLEEKSEAIFHQFGVGYEEFESGLGNYSTAIVEYHDGTVDNIPVNHIRFIKE